MTSHNNRIDVNPQWFAMTVVESAANTYTEKEHEIPAGINVGADKVMVMEILSILFDHSPGAMDNGDIVYVAVYDRSKTAIPSLNDPGVLMRYRFQTGGAFANGIIGLQTPFQFTLADGSGNGTLYAKRKMYIGVLGTSQASPITASAKILYRLKHVSAQEFLGIVAEG